MGTKFDKLSTRIETIDRKAKAAETLAKQNQNSMSDLNSYKWVHSSSRKISKTGEENTWTWGEHWRPG